MENKTPMRLVRFDFPPGATPKEIADALRKAHEDIVRRRKAEETTPWPDPTDAPLPPQAPPPYPD